MTVLGIEPVAGPVWLNQVMLWYQQPSTADPAYHHHSGFQAAAGATLSNVADPPVLQGLELVIKCSNWEVKSSTLSTLYWPELTTPPHNKGDRTDNPGQRQRADDHPPANTHPRPPQGWCLTFLHPSFMPFPPLRGAKLSPGLCHFHSRIKESFPSQFRKRNL